VDSQWFAITKLLSCPKSFSNAWSSSMLCTFQRSLRQNTVANSFEQRHPASWLCITAAAELCKETQQERPGSATQSMTLNGLLCVGCSARPSRGSNSGGEPPPSGRTNGKGLRHFSMKVQSATLVHGYTRLSCNTPAFCIYMHTSQAVVLHHNRLWADQSSNRSSVYVPCS